MTEKFERHLRESNLSENTVASYLFAVKQYQEQYDKVTQRNLKAYKVWLIESYSPKTVNLRLRAMNCYPHSFRHRFAKSFLERCNDIAFLADLMGHESIETTRIYLRKTATEQRTIVDNVIDW